MKFLLPPSLLVVVSALAWGQAPAPAASDPVVITVGEEKITQSQFEAIMDQVSARMPEPRKAAMRTPQGKKQFAEQYAELKALAQEARARKIDQTPEAKLQIMLSSDQVLAQILYAQLGKTAKPADAELHAYYDAHKAEYDEVTARHILIRMKGSQVPLRPDEKDLTDEEALAKAKEIRAKLVAGGDFAATAKVESDDTGSGANGGELGPFTHGRMVPAFEQAAFSLKVNEISEPVKSQFGYHIIQVEKREAKSFDEARPEIEQKMGPEMAQKAVDQVKDKTKISYDSTYFPAK